MAITNCLNFGNPYNEEVYYQFAHAIMGMKSACEKFGTPVTGGNVSFYNQSSDVGPVLPTPTIGMMGLLQNHENKMGIAFRKVGDLIYLLGKNVNDLASSQYLIHHHGVKNSPAPYFNLDEEFDLHQLVREVIAEKMVVSAHDISEGGLFMNLLESAMINDLGCDIEMKDDGMRMDALLFGEAQGRVVVTVKPKHQAAFEALCKKDIVPVELIGSVTTGDISINGVEFGRSRHFKTVYDSSLEELMNAN